MHKTKMFHLFSASLVLTACLLADLKDLTFKESFKFGIGDSAFQTEGVYGPQGKQCRNNWTQWQGKTNPAGQPWIYQQQEIGNACDRWNRYEDDIALMAESGFQMYRFSVEWSKVEPTRGVFDEEALAHYEAVVDCALAHGLEPFVTLFHHTWPVWFGELGSEQDGFGFENKENLTDFLEYCKKVFERLHGKVKKWIILNEPAGYAIQGWWRGEYPPAKKDLKLAGVVLNNMLDGHVLAYDAFKKIDSTVEIGIATIIQPITPYHKWNPFELAACLFSDNLLNNATLDFFSSGKFNWGWAITGKSVHIYNPYAVGKLDFLGINYYTHTILSGNWDFKNFIAPTERYHDQISDDGKIVYPQGLAWAVERGAQLGIPMYIMENGVADAGDRVREQYIEEHLKVTEQMAKKYDIRGYFYWTLMGKTFEWRKGYSIDYGLFACNPKTQERTLRGSAKPFIEFLKSRRLEELTIA